MSMAAIIDWRGSVIRTLFQTVIPDFVDLGMGNMEHASSLASTRYLSLGKKLKTCAGVTLGRVKVSQMTIRCNRYQIGYLWFPICYSSRSRSSGLPLLGTVLAIADSCTEDYIPTSSDYLVYSLSLCEDVKRLKKEVKDTNHPEEWLDVHIAGLMKTKCAYCSKRTSNARM
ncbi:hypothetical protein L208DRAFT_921727 [Tricholoma matsutake]|nr:hypothetical protein L208DRAFT_921727 [Tricholoma matsutake 945]